MRGLLSILLTCCAAIVVTVAEDQQPPPYQELGSSRLLVSKAFLSQYAVVDRDFVVEYQIYNIGDKPALKVVLDDRHSFPTNSFDIVRGLLQVRWERLAPGANVSHSVVMRPRTFGQFNYTAAQVAYYPSEDSKDYRIGYSTSPGEGYVYRLKDYERKFSPHVVDWCIFALMVTPCIGLPLMLWYKTKSKYEIDSKKSK